MYTKIPENIVLQTQRLYLRKMSEQDYGDLCSILQDEEVMYAYEHAFSNEEVWQWLHNQLRRYKEYGFGLWAVILKENGAFIGQAGLSIQNCDGLEVLEIGYLFNKNYWHKGYATEAAIACKEYAFNVLCYKKVYSIIRENNIPSQNVAKRNGMAVRGSFVKHYYGMDMPHLIFETEDKE